MNTLIDYRSRCVAMHTALTTADGAWPPDGSSPWVAGSASAFAQLEDCFLTYLVDMGGTERPGRIWAQGDAHYLMHDLCAAVATCRLYGNGERWRRFVSQLEHMQRPHKLYHDRSGEQHYLSCLLHGRQLAVTAERAEQGHASGERCPRCRNNIEQRGYRL